MLADNSGTARLVVVFSKYVVPLTLTMAVIWNAEGSVPELLGHGLPYMKTHYSVLSVPYESAARRFRIKSRSEMPRDAQPEVKDEPVWHVALTLSRSIGLV